MATATQAKGVGGRGYCQGCHSVWNFGLEMSKLEVRLGFINRFMWLLGGECLAFPLEAAGHAR